MSPPGHLVSLLRRCLKPLPAGAAGRRLAKPARRLGSGLLKTAAGAVGNVAAAAH